MPKEPKNIEELENLTRAELRDIRIIEDKISRLQTTFWQDEAERYLLPMPTFNTVVGGAWEKATNGHYQLKPAAIAELRSAIRREEKERVTDGCHLPRWQWQVWAA